MEFEYIETERLLLRKFTPEDLKYIFSSYSREEANKILGFASDEEFDKFKAKSDGGFVTYDRTVVHFRLIVKSTNEIIGGGGFHNWYAMHRRAELGYMLSFDKDKQKGYMSEAVEALLHYGFTTMNLNRIEAFINPNNIASLALIKKFGFKKEGQLRQHFVTDGTAEDSIIFALLREEYLENTKQANSIS